MIELTFNVYSLLISIAFIIALTFGFLLLFSRHQNKKADRFLAGLMFVVALWNASILVLDLSIYRYAAGIIWIPLEFTLALGPCFYFYTRFMTESGIGPKLSVWPHFIPVVFQVLLFLFEVFQGLPLGLGYFETSVFAIFDPIVNVLAILSLLIYGYLARKRIKKYHQWVANNYSHFHRYHLDWLFRLSTIILLLLSIWLGYFLMDFMLFDYQLSFRAYYPFHLILAVITIWLSAEAFIKPDVDYSDQNISSESTKKPTKVTDKELREKAFWLNQQIATNLFYLDPELSLKSLADALEIHPHVVSRIINEGLEQTFSTCINGHRVEAVIKKLKNNLEGKTTYLAIAFECGFNSKTTFNRVFKKHTGQTPLQYSNGL